MRLAILLVLACGTAGRSQSGSEAGLGQSPMHQTQFPGRTGFDSSEDYDPVIAEKHLLAFNIERQKQMVANANKLLKLARELNEEVAASNTGTLTPEQLRKVAEIEKLARSVKERMTAGSVQPQPVIPPPGFIYPAH
jgi:hypothetical protein